MAATLNSGMKHFANSHLIWIATHLRFHYSGRVTATQERNCGRTRVFRASVFLLFLLFSIPGLRCFPLAACDIDLLAIIETETASFPVSTSWVEAAHATALLSDALNAGLPDKSIIARWNAASLAVSAVYPQLEPVLAEGLSSATRLVNTLIASGDFIAAHEALQRQFRFIIQGISRLEIPVRVSSLADLAGTTWSLVEAARDRDKRRFCNETTKLSGSIQALERSCNISSDTDLTEAVRYWAAELEKCSARAGDEWPDELLLAASQLKNALIQFHRTIRIR